MPTVKVEHDYQNLEAIYEHYKIPNIKILFESNEYEFIQAKRLKDKSLHLYRCEKEQHNLKIHLHGGVVFYVEGSYSIGGMHHMQK